MRKVNVVKLYPNSIRFGDEQSKGEEIVQQKKKIKICILQFFELFNISTILSNSIKKDHFFKSLFWG